MLRLMPSMLALIAVQRQTAILRSTRPWRREQHGCTAGDPMVALTKLSTLAHTPSLRASPVTDDDFPDVHPTFYFITGKYMLFSKGCKLVGCGSAVPSLSVSNDDLAKIVDTSDEWIFFCTGIRNRRVVSDVEPDDLELILMCISTPEDIFGDAPKVENNFRGRPPAIMNCSPWDSIPRPQAQYHIIHSSHHTKPSKSILSRQPVKNYHPRNQIELSNVSREPNESMPVNFVLPFSNVFPDPASSNM
ncbi:hypothetical protein F3Y22_tig00110788pilonHSYRG00042 [Hibiscus syriacus]|uniref:Uncharacterized protein n=1 Tax=Hibiscus syriacus TaxID=106335 RepID=A0A6A2ZQZ0_HIBSY|nr:hypothetical protein F3Y22_tig00110788pilonHSYRG00042 [Hibiscus syriacus]